MKIKPAEIGRLGLIQENQDGSISQIGLTHEQSEALQICVSLIADGKPLVRLPKHFNLRLVGK
jgi:hypothetical protein